MTVVFFGHRDTPSEVKRPLKKIIKMLIENYGADKFYVGNQGNFDRIVRGELKKLKKEYDFSYGVVLAYFPFEKNNNEDYTDTLYPEEMNGL